VTHRIRIAFQSLVIVAIVSWNFPAQGQEVVIFASVEGAIEWLEQEQFWGEENRGKQLDVPRVLLTGINPRWRKAAQELPVSHKKEIFYRAMLPLILHANGMVLERRLKLLEAKRVFETGADIPPDDLEQLRAGAVLLRVMDAENAAKLGPDHADFARILDELLYKLDIIPAGLALGQAAYESGYGTSRFAIEGNALFGQWTYSGGMAPEQKREEKGNYGVAAFDWPFDSVRGYFLNLMSHPAYEDFRRLRAELRAAGEPLNSLRLADGLLRYSERGQDYVDSLKGMIRVNGLDIADDAVFRDEPIRFILSEGTPEEAAALEQRIAEARASGELAEIYARMRLE